MPIYEYICECGCEVEKVQKIGSDAPICSKCGGAMTKKISPIAFFRIENEGGYPIKSKGYKEGYKEEYLKSKGQELWRDTIVSS